MRVRSWDWAIAAGLIALAGLIGGVCAGCSSGPQTPIQAPPTTIQIDARACDHRQTPETTAGGEMVDGPAVGGACNVVLWIDTRPSSSQVTRGVETGEVDVSPETEVGLTEGL